VGRHVKKNALRGFGVCLSLFLAFGSLSLTQVFIDSKPASANEFDTALGTLTFNELTQARTIFRGSGAGTVETKPPLGTISDNGGRLLNDRVLYSSVITIDGTPIDALVTTVSLGDRATIGKFDGGQAVSSAPNLFQSELSYPANSTDKRVTFSFRFFVGGTYNGVQDAGTVAVLKNVLVNSYDLDSTQFTEMTGFQSYFVSSNTTLRIDNSTVGRTRFVDNVAGGASTWTAADGSYTKGRVQAKFNSLSSFEVSIGAEGGSGSWFAIDFGAGYGWTEGATLFTPVETLNLEGNRPPTSTNTTLNVTAGNAVTLDRSEFGNYSDPDSNILVSVRIDSIPNTATLERQVGGTWTAVTNGTVIPTSDIDSGKLRYIHAGVTNDQLSFSVNDGLVFSTSQNTITFVPVSQAQTITFLNPGNKTPNQTISSSATASSGLTVTLSSSTPGVCTVSGLSIVLTGTEGTCTITANQAGNGSFAAAPFVTQSFQVSAVVVDYTLTYDGNSPFSGSAPTSEVGSGAVTIKANTGNLTKSGFSFGGWLINGVEYAPGDIYTLSANATATAIWTPVYTLTYDSNSPTSGLAPADQVDSGFVAVRSNSGNLTKTGYTFGGWSINGVTFAPGASFNLSADATATAIWTPVVPDNPTPTATVPSSQGDQKLAQTGFASGEYLMLVPLFLFIAGFGSVVLARKI
jgi:hypothetical protein